MKTLSAVSLLVLFTGCAASNGANYLFFNSLQEKQLRDTSRLELDPPRFAFRTSGNTLATPPDDPRSEQMRVGFLEHHLRLNAACPNGYEVLDRKLMKTAPGGMLDGPGQYFFEIIYSGRCTP